jgi:hypothetical protein
MSDDIESPNPDEAPLTEGVAFPTLEEMRMLLPQYEFHDVLGVGGMGAVYLARQAALDRWVAIKLLPVSAAQNEEDARRFITEARSMARLNHAHIAAVYDFGQTTQGHLYLVMEHVNGLDLHRLIQRGEMTPERIRSLVPQMCDALTYAHSHNLIHRDIKPANILITEDWQVKVIDFGLARDQDTETAGEAEYGTPDYVAPERLEDDVKVDHRADIYALGVVIHEMFTKLTPQAAGAAAGQGVPQAYSSVVNRCMNADPAQRFQQCGEIKSFLLNAALMAAPKPLSAPAPAQRALPPQLQGRVPMPTTQRRAARQQAGSSGWLWAAACMILLVIGGWYVQQQQLSQTKPDAAAATAAAAPAEAAEQTRMAKVTAAPTPTLISDAPAGPFKPEGGEFALLKRLKGHNELVYACAILADQRHAVSGGHDDTLILWDVATGAVVKRFPAPFPDIHGIEAAADGNRILLHSFRGHQVAIFDLEQGKTTASIKAPANRLTLATWTADQKSVYILNNDTNGGVYFWDPAKGAVLQQFSEWPRAAYHIFSLPATTHGAASQVLVIGSTMKPNPNPGTGPGQGLSLLMDKPWAALFAEPEHRLISDLPDYKNIRNRLSLSPDGSTLVGGLSTLYLVDVPAMTPRFLINPPDNVSCTSSAWTGAGRLLVCAYANGKLYLMEADTGAELASLDIGLRANTLSISQDERWMLVSAFPLDVKNPQPDDFDVLVIRLPDLNKLGTHKGFHNLATRQNSQLEKFDPELALLRSQAAVPQSLAQDEQLEAQIRDLTSKYGAALKRSAVTASPKEQLAMHAEANAIAAGNPVPDPLTDVTTSGEHKRFRLIYRDQMTQLEKRRQEAVETLRKSLAAGVKTLADKRQQSGDRQGTARCEVLLASMGTPKPFGEVVAAAFGHSGSH